MFLFKYGSQSIYDDKVNIQEGYALRYRLCLQ